MVSMLLILLFKAYLSCSKPALPLSTYSNTPTETRAVCHYFSWAGEIPASSPSIDPRVPWVQHTKVPVVTTLAGPPSELITISNSSNGNSNSSIMYAVLQSQNTATKYLVKTELRPEFDYAWCLHCERILYFRF